MKKIILFLFIINNAISFAQKPDSISSRKNAIYLEGGGNALIYSCNYERQIGINNFGITFIRMGFEELGAFGNSSDAGLIFPIIITRINNKNKNNHFEFGGGMCLIADLDKKNSHLNFTSPTVTANLMYRYQKPNGRFIFRIGWTPSYFITAANQGFGTILLLLWPGMSIGYAF